jgi:hypothetical protein
VAVKPVLLHPVIKIHFLRSRMWFDIPSHAIQRPRFSLFSPITFFLQRVTFPSRMYPFQNLFSPFPNHFILCHSSPGFPCSFSSASLFNALSFSRTPASPSD